jgi:selenocysteine lyase/cysteine desulfurase
MEKHRRQFPITREFTFLNHAAVSPISSRVVKAMASYAKEASRGAITCYGRWVRRVKEVRSLVARLVGAEAEEIAFVGNTSDGLSLVAEGLQWKPGDKVMVSHPDFPTNIYPWMNLRRLGVEPIFIPRINGSLKVKDVKNALQPGAKMLTVSSVDFRTGFRADLEGLGQLCREKGIFFCVDAIQSLGIIPVDVKACGIHFLAAGGQKWLLGPMGCGGLFVHKDLIGGVHPNRVGWKSVKDEENFFDIDFNLKNDAQRFESGTLNLPGIFGLGAAIEFLFEVGIEKIHKRVLALNDILADGLCERGLKIVSPLDFEKRSGIISFIPDTSPQRVVQSLFDQKVLVSERKGLIRVSPHFYNNGADIQRFFEALDKRSQSRNP